MSAAEAKALLKRTALLATIPDDWLTFLAEHSFLRTYRKGQMLFCQGDAGDAAYVMAEGLVKLVRTSAEGNSLLLGLRRPPEVFGEISICDGGERAANAEALRTPTRVLVIRREPILALIDQNPAISKMMLVTFSALLREAIERAFDFVFLDLKGRVAKILLEFAGGQRRPDSGETIIELDLHQADVAAMVGGSRQSVNKVLKDMESRGLLRLEGRTIVLCQPEELKRRAGL